MKKLFMEMMRYIKMGLFLFWYGNTSGEIKDDSEEINALIKTTPKTSDTEGTDSNQQAALYTRRTKKRRSGISLGLVGGGCVGIGTGSFGVDVYGRPGPMI